MLVPVLFSAIYWWNLLWTLDLTKGEAVGVLRRDWRRGDGRLRSDVWDAVELRHSGDRARSPLLQLREREDRRIRIRRMRLQEAPDLRAPGCPPPLPGLSPEEGKENKGKKSEKKKEFEWFACFLIYFLLFSSGKESSVERRGQEETLY